MEQIKNRYGLAIEAGVFGRIHNGDFYFFDYIEYWKDVITNTSDYHRVNVCWLWSGQKELKECLINRGNFAVRKSGYNQFFTMEPMTQAQFDDLISYADTLITMRQFIEGLPNLKDGYYFIRLQDETEKGTVEQPAPVKAETPAPSAPSTPSPSQSPSSYLTIEQILDEISGLAESQGSYGRLLQSILDFKSEDPEGYAKWSKELEGMNFADTLDIVLYFEEDRLPKNCPSKQPEKATVKTAPKAKEAKYSGVGENTQKVLDLVTPKTGTAVKRVAKQQLEKYGNDDIFDITIKEDRITVTLGDYGITFFFKPHQETAYDVTGTAQGCRYIKLLAAIARDARRRILLKEAVDNGSSGIKKTTRDI